MMKSVLIAHTLSTLFMVGLIWFVQVVHYPLFSRVGTATFPAYAALHIRWTTWVVAPPMLVELLTGVLLLALRPPEVASWLLWAGLFLLVVIWSSTWLLQVPQHANLAEGFNLAAYHRLVRSNWIRTVAWSLRGALALLIWLRATQVTE